MNSSKETYASLLSTLREDIKSLNLKREKLKEPQKNVLDFIEGKKQSAQIIHDGHVVQLLRGEHNHSTNNGWGLEHILFRHYGKNKEGRVSARDILNIFYYFNQYRETTDVENEYKDKKVFQFFKINSADNIRIRLINSEKGMIYSVTSFFSNLEEVKETVDLS